MFDVQAFAITEGGHLLKAFEDKATASGYPIQRWFCTSCGSNVYMRPTRPKSRVVVVGLGGLDSYISGEAEALESGNDNLAGCAAWGSSLSESN